MKRQINVLRQMQELVLTRDEHQRLGDGSRIEGLTASIDALRATLDAQVGGLYDRLYKRAHVVVAPVTNGCCGVCGMQVSTSQAQQVRFAEHLTSCTSCGRILYAVAPEEVHNVAERPNEDDVPRNGLSRFSAEVLMLPQMKAKNKEEAIAALAGLMAEHHFIDKADALTQAALEREAVLSTAMEGGFAFPHVRGVEGGGLTLAMGVAPKGIDWDGEKVEIVFLTAIPVAVSAFYLNLLGGICKGFAKSENVAAVKAAATPEALWKALLKATRGWVK